MARAAEALREFAHDLYPNEPLVEERRARSAITLCLSPDQAHDAPVGLSLQKHLGRPMYPISWVMDRAHKGKENRQLALDLGYTPVVPPLRPRVDAWTYDRILYKRRNEIERLFRRLKGFRRIFSRFEKLDFMYRTFICFALIVEALR